MSAEATLAETEDAKMESVITGASASQDMVAATVNKVSKIFADMMSPFEFQSSTCKFLITYCKRNCNKQLKHF